MNAITTDKTAANVIPITPAQALDELCEQWVAAKRAENEANARRVQIEALIITVTGCKEEGSETTTTPAGRKVTVTGKLSYSADIDELVKLAARLPENMRPVKYEPTLDSTGAKPGPAFSGAGALPVLPRGAS